jgi:hypothetical protein
LRRANAAPVQSIKRSFFAAPTIWQGTARDDCVWLCADEHMFVYNILYTIYCIHDWKFWIVWKFRRTNVLFGMYTSEKINYRKSWRRKNILYIVYQINFYNYIVYVVVTLS